MEDVEAPEENLVEQEVLESDSEQVQVAPDESTESESDAPQQEEDEREERNARNWRRANEKRKYLERKLKEKDEQMEKLLQAVSIQQQAPMAKPEEIDELDSIGDEDYIPKGQISKLVKREAERIRQQARQEVQQELQQREQERWKDKLCAKYSDFEDVVNLDTLDLLEQEDPEMAATIAELKDPYKVGLQTYKYIKAMGITNKVSGHRQKKEVAKKLKENSKTLQSPQVYDKRPLAQAYKLTEEDTATLFEEMYGAAQKAGFGY